MVISRCNEKGNSDICCSDIDLTSIIVEILIEIPEEIATGNFLTQEFQLEIYLIMLQKILQQLLQEYYWYSFKNLQVYNIGWNAPRSHFGISQAIF